MYSVERRIGIDMGHRVPFHKSKCSNIHGHRYTVLAVAEAPETVSYGGEASEAGMLVDFGDLKQVMMEQIHDPFDHKLVLWEEDPLLVEMNLNPSILEWWEGNGQIIRSIPVIPTAEELARYWFGRVRDALRSFPHATGLRLQQIDVYETPNNKASYSPHFSS